MVSVPPQTETDATSTRLQVVVSGEPGLSEVRIALWDVAPPASCVLFEALASRTPAGIGLQVITDHDVVPLADLEWFFTHARTHLAGYM